MVLTEDMLKYLESAFPDKCPSRTTVDRDIWYYAGQVAIVKLIRHKLEEAQETTPEVLK
jgi:hypothetical protein